MPDGTVSITRTLVGRPARYAAAAFLLALPAHAADCPRYEVVTVLAGEPCGLVYETIRPHDMNVHGHVCGELNCFDDGRAFVWYGDDILEIPMPEGAERSAAHALNDDGVVVGFVAFSASDRHAFSFDGTDLELLPGLSNDGASWANDINEHGTAVGWAMGPEDAMPVRWDRSIVSVLRSVTSAQCLFIDDADVAVGYTNSLSSRGLLWQDDATITLQPAEGHHQSHAYAANAQDSVVGTSIKSIGIGQSEVHPVIWNASGSLTNLGIVPGFDDCWANCIADSGLAGGSCETPQHAFLWSNGRSFNLNAGLVEDSGRVHAFRHVRQIDQTGRLLVLVSVDTTATAILAPVPPIEGDVTCDGTVGFQDLLRVLASWGPCPDCLTDLTDDRVVDVRDLSKVLMSWVP